MHNSTNDTLSGNDSRGNPMSMLLTDEVLRGEGDSNSQIIKDSSSRTSILVECLQVGTSTCCTFLIIHVYLQLFIVLI